MDNLLITDAAYGSTIPFDLDLTAELMAVAKKRLSKLAEQLNISDARVKENMKAVLADVQNGNFAKRFIEDQDAGAPEFKAAREKGAQHPIEAVGRELRRMMSWVKNDKDDYKEGSAARG